jgi:hypothetical protein
MPFLPIADEIDADVTGHGDVPVTLDSEVVSVDATGQGDVPITLDSEVVAVDATGQGDVPITLDGEEVTVNLGATDNAVLDNIDSNTDYGAVVGGGAEATALRVTLANDSTGVVSVDDGGGTLTVDGTVTAELSATDNGVLDTIATNTGASLTDTELRATPVPVSGTLTGITNDVSIDDGGNTITVDGEVTANLGATDNAVLDSIDSDTSDIKTAVEILDNAIDGTEMQVDVVASLPAGTNAIGKLAANSGVDIGDVDVTSIAAGETHVGQVGMEDNVITITPTLDTSAYADGDVLFETEAIANAVRNNGESCILQSIHVLDKGDQGEDFELVFLDEDQDLGTANAAVSISEANSTKIIGHYAFSNSYVDLINTQIRCDTGIGLVLKAGAATTSLYVGGISKGTGTYADGDIVIKLGLLRN